MAMPITPETIRLVRQLRREADRIADGATRNLTRAWAAAWDDLADLFLSAAEDLALRMQDGQQLSRGQILRSLRVRLALDQAAHALAKLSADAGTEIAKAAGQALRAATTATGQIIASQLPRAAAATATLVARFDRLDPAAVAWMVHRTTQRIASLLRPLTAAAIHAMERELVRGVVVGDNPRTVAAKIVKRTEGAFNGGLTRALVIARTETIDAHRAGATAAQHANSDVLAGWMWHAELSRGRTCPSCWAKHGTVYPLAEPGPIDHQQGRCSRTPKTKSWAELGFDIPEPADSGTPDARKIFDSLPQADRVAIMGRRRLELLDSGAIDWPDLAALRTTPGWRDSWGVRPLRDLERIAKAKG